MNQINNDSSDESDDEEYVDDLSDNEDFETDTSEKFLLELQRGVLPIELQFLYSLTLIGEGNAHYIAFNYFKAIKLLDDGDESIAISSRLQRSEQEANDTGIYADKSWIIFRNSMTKPIQRTAAFAIASDAFQKMNKENEWALKFSDHFNDQLEYLEKRGDLDFFFKTEESNQQETSLILSTLKNQLITVLLASCRMNLIKTQKMMNLVNKSVTQAETSEDAKNQTKEKVLEIEDCANSILEIVLRYRNALWRNAMSDDGGIEPTAVEVRCCDFAIFLFRM